MRYWQTSVFGHIFRCRVTFKQATGTNYIIKLTITGLQGNNKSGGRNVKP